MFLFSSYDVTVYNDLKNIYPVFWNDFKYIKGSLKETYNRPLLVEDLIDFERILGGLILQPTQKVDMLFTQTVSFCNTINESFLFFYNINDDDFNIIDNFT